MNRAIAGIDGFKPVQRRILYSMFAEHVNSFRKSAKIVGTTMGSFHPHGDASIYTAMVNMTAAYKNNLPLIDGQGNFGSLDGSPPAAMRYTEVKLSALAKEVFANDLAWEGIVEMVPNYDSSVKEPVVLPTCLPMALVNGTSGIGVSIACDIPPYNTSEIIKAIQYIAGAKKVDPEKVLDLVPAPDFPIPTVIKKSDLALVREIQKTGTGTATLYAPILIDNTKPKQGVVVGLPPDISTETVVRELSELDFVTNVSDESAKEIRIVFTCNQPVVACIEQLYKRTKLACTIRNSFYLITEEGKLCPTNLVDYLIRFVEFRKQTLERRLNAQIVQCQKQIGQKDAVQKVIGDIDRFLKIVKNSKDRKEAAEELVKAYKIELWQAEHVLSLAIGTITQAERGKILQELQDLQNLLKSLQEDLKRLPVLVVEEQQAIYDRLTKENRLALERKTQIYEQPYRILAHVK